MGQTVRVIAVLLLIVGGAGRIPAQGANGHSGPEVPDSSHSLQVREAVKQLLQSADVATATLRAEVLRNVPGGRVELQRLIEDPGVPDHVLRGILTCVVEKNDRTGGLIDAILNAYGNSEGARKHCIREALQAYDAKGSISREPLGHMSQGNEAHRRDYLEVTVALADTDEERRDISGVLIGMLQLEQDPVASREIMLALGDLTYHGYVKPQEWAEWYQRFLKAHPTGFTHRDLALDAVAEGHQTLMARMAEEAMRGVRLLAAAKVLPLDYLDHNTTPYPEVRRLAVERTAAVAAGDAARAAEAVRALVKVLEIDPGLGVQHAAIEGLGNLAQAHPELSATVGAAVLPRLQDADLTTVKQAVFALRKSNYPPAGKPLGELYIALKDGSASTETAELRREIVSALASLAGQESVISEALGDADPGVRTAAANTLALLGRPEHAERLAQALLAEKDAQVQQRLLSAIGQLGNFDPPLVVESLQRFSAENERAQRQALEALLLALARPEWGRGSGDRQKVEQHLLELYPRGIERNVRSAIISRITENVPRGLVGVLSQWTVAEIDEELKRELALALSRSPQAEVRLVLSAGRKLHEQGSLANANLLIRSIVERPKTSDAAQPDAEQMAQARVLWARILYEIGSSESLAQAEVLLDEELKTAPPARKAELQWLRGLVRVKADKRPAALEDLEGAFEVVVSRLRGDDLIDAAATLAGVYLDTGAADEALAVLSKVGEAQQSRRLRYVKALCELGRKDARAAFDEAMAISLEGQAPPTVEQVLRLRIEAGLSLPDPAARAEAIAAFDRLAERAAGNGSGSLPFQERVSAEKGLRQTVERFDLAEDAASRAQLETELLRCQPAAIAPWLIYGASALATAANGTAGDVLSRRLAVLKKLFPGSSDLQGIQEPENRSSPEQLAHLASQLESWWSRYKS